MKKFKTPLWFSVPVLIGIFLYFTTGVGDELTLESLKSNQQALVGSFEKNPLELSLAFGANCVQVSAFSNSGATVLSFAAGSIFGTLTGTLISSLGNTLGRTASFLMPRFIFRDPIADKFRDRLTKFDRWSSEANALAHLKKFRA